MEYVAIVGGCLAVVVLAVCYGVYWFFRRSSFAFAQTRSVNTGQQPEPSVPAGIPTDTSHNAQRDRLGTLDMILHGFQVMVPLMMRPSIPQEILDELNNRFAEGVPCYENVANVPDYIAAGEELLDKLRILVGTRAIDAPVAVLESIKAYNEKYRPGHTA